MLRCFLIIALIFAAVLSSAQSADSTSGPYGRVELRPFDTDAIEALRADPAYDYDKDLRRLPTPWERFKEWLAGVGGELFRDPASANFFTHNVFYILAVVVLVFAAFMLSKGGLRRVFHGAPRSVARGGDRCARTSAKWTSACLDRRGRERSGDLRRADPPALPARAAQTGGCRRAALEPRPYRPRLHGADRRR